MNCRNVKFFAMDSGAPESTPLMDAKDAKDTTTSSTYIGNPKDVPFRFHYFTQGNSSIWNCCS